MESPTNVLTVTLAKDNKHQDNGEAVRLLPLVVEKVSNGDMPDQCKAVFTAIGISMMHGRGSPASRPVQVLKGVMEAIAGKTINFWPEALVAAKEFVGE